MTLLDSKKGYHYIIKAIHCTQQELLERFYAMGIYEGNLLTLEHTSALKHTYSINIYGTQIALRKNEAQLIEIEPQNN